MQDRERQDKQDDLLPNRFEGLTSTILPRKTFGFPNTFWTQATGFEQSLCDLRELCGLFYFLNVSTIHATTIINARHRTIP